MPYFSLLEIDCLDLILRQLASQVWRLSPTEFIQMKGRGTRLFDFKECWIDEKEIPKTINSIKSSYKLFDYFKNFQYFEEEFDYHLPNMYDEIITNIGDYD
mgnify:CR=1 FL=1